MVCTIFNYNKRFFDRMKTSLLSNTQMVKIVLHNISNLDGHVNKQSFIVASKKSQKLHQKLFQQWQLGVVRALPLWLSPRGKI